MKKLLCLLLITAMLSGLCSCGASSYEGTKVTAIVRGNDSKELKITFTGESLSECGFSDMTEELEGGAMFFKADHEIKKNGDIVCRVRGLEPGISNYTVNFTQYGEFYAIAIADIKVDEKNKVSCLGITVLDEPDFIDLNCDEGINARATYFDLPYKNIILSNETGSWRIGSYDDTVVTVDPLYDSDEGECVATVTAVGEGKTGLQLINRDAKTQLMVMFKSVRENEDFTLSIEDSYSCPLTRDEDTALIEKNKASTESAREAYPWAHVPAGAVILDAALFDDDYEEQNTEAAEPGSEAQAVSEVPAGSEDPGEASSAEEADTRALTLSLEYEDMLMYCNIYRKGDLEDMISRLQSVEPSAKPEEITAGGKSVTFFFYERGFGAAAWEDDGCVYYLTFLGEGQTAETDRELLAAFIEEGGN